MEFEKVRSFLLLLRSAISDESKFDWMVYFAMKLWSLH